MIDSQHTFRTNVECGDQVVKLIIDGFRASFFHFLVISVLFSLRIIRKLSQKIGGISRKSSIVTDLQPNLQFEPNDISRKWGYF